MILTKIILLHVLVSLTIAKAPTDDDDMVFNPWVVGGDDATDQWPFMASLQFYDTWMGNFYPVCGASLISQYHLVTAAHCVDERIGGDGRSDPSMYRVMLGGLDLMLGESESDDVYISLSDINRHPSWLISVYDGFPNDIALIKLSSPAPLSRSDIGAVVLPSANFNFAGSPDCHIIGWGLTDENAEFSPSILQEAKTSVTAATDCQEQIVTSMLSDIHVCVGGKGAPTACHGDSGGPLVCKVDTEWQLAGVGSWSTSCDIVPTIYVNVTHVIPWIIQNMST